MSIINKYPLNKKQEIEIDSITFDSFEKFEFSPHTEIDGLVSPLSKTTFYLREPIDTKDAKKSAFTLLRITKLGLQILFLDAVIADIGLQIACAKERVSKIATFTERDEVIFPERDNSCSEFQYLALKYFRYRHGMPINKDLDEKTCEEIENFVDHEKESVKNLAILIRDAYIVSKGNFLAGTLGAQCNRLVRRFVEELNTVTCHNPMPHTFRMLHCFDNELAWYPDYPFTTHLRIKEKDKLFLQQCFRAKKLIGYLLRSDHLNYERRYYDFYSPHLTSLQRKLLTDPNATYTNDDIDALVAEIEGADVNSKKEKKNASPKKVESPKVTQKFEKKAPETKEGSSSSSKTIIRKTLPEKEKALLEHFTKANPFQYQPRVSQWLFDPKENLERIRAFPGYESYPNLSYAHAIHAFPEIEKITSHTELCKKYVKKTGRGFAIYGELHLGEEVMTGVFQFGVDRDSGAIFHRVFHSVSVDDIKNNNISKVGDTRDHFYDKLAINQTYVRDTKITLEKTEKIIFEDDVTGLKCAIMPNPN